jgi:hypothetical protein
VEECIDGKPLTMLELRNPWIAKKIMEILCETNYDTKLNELIVQIKGTDANHSMQFIQEKQKGWFHTYLDRVRPILKGSELFQKNERAKHIFDYFETLLHDPKDVI